MSRTDRASETRLPDVPYHTIRLADGNDWGFSLPGRRVVPSVVRSRDALGGTIESVSARTEVSYPLEIRHKCQQLWKVHPTGTPDQQQDAFISLAIAMLRRAHDIDHEEARALLSVSDESWPRVVEDVLALVLSRGPGT